MVTSHTFHMAPSSSVYYMVIYISIMRFCASGHGHEQLPLLRQRVFQEDFLYVGEGTGHVSCVGKPPDTT